MSELSNSLTHRVSFGIRVPNSGPLATGASMVEVAQEAEALGYDSVWVHDHLTWSDEIHRTHISSGADHGGGGNPSPDFYEAMTSLAYLAGQVHSVRLGIACVVVPCRNPLLAAKQIATLDVLCQGRLDIGVGIGSVQLRRAIRQIPGRRDLPQANAKTSSAALGRRLDRGGHAAHGGARRRLAAGLAAAGRYRQAFS
jgi:alkanesulfonate monooxygenase SsuD/methylene tetrahydromethanopterin reductase-like flavin-dependent oxidoreductase (luciferase family)